MAQQKLRRKDGRLTAYGLACGYVEKFEGGGKILTLWHEGGTVYHVRLYDLDNHTRVFWEGFEKLTEARKLFDVTKKRMQNAEIYA